MNLSFGTLVFTVGFLKNWVASDDVSMNALLATEGHHILRVIFCPDSCGRRNAKSRRTEMRAHGMTRLKV